jgi:hypothetical protein
MKEIAAEHNIEWDSSDFEAELLKAPENLLVRNIAIVLPPCPHHHYLFMLFSNT